MKPLFDFNEDGKMDMMEFLIATGTFDPNSPMNPKGSQKKNKLFDEDDKKDDFFEDDDE